MFDKAPHSLLDCGGCRSGVQRWRLPKSVKPQLGSTPSTAQRYVYPFQVQPFRCIMEGEFHRTTPEERTHPVHRSSMTAQPFQRTTTMPEPRTSILARGYGLLTIDQHQISGVEYAICSNDSETFGLAIIDTEDAYTVYRSQHRPAVLKTENGDQLAIYFDQYWMYLPNFSLPMHFVFYFEPQ